MVLLDAKVDLIKANIELKKFDSCKWPVFGIRQFNWNQNV